MKTSNGLALLIALMLAPIAGIARAFAPRGVDALNVQGFYDGPFTRTAEGALTEHLLVTFGTAPGSQVKVNTAATRPLGTVADEAASGAKVAVIPLPDGKPKLMIASKAIAAGVRVYGTAGGKVTDAVVSGAYLVGEALTAAAADGSELTVLPLSPVVNP